MWFILSTLLNSFQKFIRWELNLKHYIPIYYLHKLSQGLQQCCMSWMLFLWLLTNWFHDLVKIRKSNNVWHTRDLLLLTQGRNKKSPFRALSFESDAVSVLINLIIKCRLLEGGRMEDGVCCQVLRVGGTLNPLSSSSYMKYIILQIYIYSPIFVILNKNY